MVIAATVCLQMCKQTTHRHDAISSAGLSPPDCNLQQIQMCHHFKYLSPTSKVPPVDLLTA